MKENEGRKDQTNTFTKRPFERNAHTEHSLLTFGCARDLGAAGGGDLAATALGVGVR